jgi:phage portal protein BeeE
MKILRGAIKVPLKVYRRQDDGSKVRLMPGDHLLADAIYQPWERAGQHQLVAAFLGSLLVHGNGTVPALSGAGNRVQFQPRDWRCLVPLQIFQGRISGWETYEDSIEEVVPAQELLDSAWYSPLGPCGVSPLHALGVTLEIEYEARQFAKPCARAVPSWTPKATRCGASQSYASPSWRASAPPSRPPTPTRCAPP